MPPAKRPQASFIHSYGPPSSVNVEPTSAIRSAYGKHEDAAASSDEPEEALRAVRRDRPERVEPDERADGEEAPCRTAAAT